MHRTQWRIHDFPWGANPRGTAHQPIIWQNFCWRLHENERIWTERGSRVPGALLRSTTGTCNFFTGTISNFLSERNQYPSNCSFIFQMSHHSTDSGFEDKEYQGVITEFSGPDAIKEVEEGFNTPRDLGMFLRRWFGKELLTSVFSWGCIIFIIWKG